MVDAFRSLLVVSEVVSQASRLNATFGMSNCGWASVPKFVVSKGSYRPSTPSVPQETIRVT